MKTILDEKCLPLNYFDKLRDQVYILVQGNMLVIEHTQKFRRTKNSESFSRQ